MVEVLKHMYQSMMEHIKDSTNVRPSGDGYTAIGLL